MHEALHAAEPDCFRDVDRAENIDLKRLVEIGVYPRSDQPCCVNNRLDLVVPDCRYEIRQVPHIAAYQFVVSRSELEAKDLVARLRVEVDNLFAALDRQLPKSG